MEPPSSGFTGERSASGPSGQCGAAAHNLLTGSTPGVRIKFLSVKKAGPVVEVYTSTGPSQPQPLAGIGNPSFPGPHRAGRVQFAEVSSECSSWLSMT